MVSFLRFAALCLTLASGALAFADETNVLRTASEINRFFTHGEGVCRYDIVAVVQHPDVNSGGWLIVYDKTGFAHLFCSAEIGTPRAGQRTHFKGNVNASHDRQEPSAEADFCEILGDAPLAPPLSVKLAALDEGKHDLADVCVEGTVIEIANDEVDHNNGFFLLKDGECVMPVAFIPQALVDRQDKLLDARVRLTGIFQRSVLGDRKFSGPFISLKGSCQASRSTKAPSSACCWTAAGTRCPSTSAPIRRAEPRHCNPTIGISPSKFLPWLRAEVLATE